MHDLCLSKFSSSEDPILETNLSAAVICDLFSLGNEYDELQGVIFPAGARVLPAGIMENFTGNVTNNPRVPIAISYKGTRK